VQGEGNQGNHKWKRKEKIKADAPAKTAEKVEANHTVVLREEARDLGEVERIGGRGIRVHSVIHVYIFICIYNLIYYYNGGNR